MRYKLMRVTYAIVCIVENHALLQHIFHGIEDYVLGHHGNIP